MSVEQGQAGIELATDAEFGPWLARAIAKLSADKDGPIFNGKAPAMVDEDDLELV